MALYSTQTIYIINEQNGKISNDLKQCKHSLLMISLMINYCIIDTECENYCK